LCTCADQTYKSKESQGKSFSPSEIDLGTTATAAPIIMLWILLSTMSLLATIFKTTSADRNEIPII
jgi:hypothetical protein